VEPTDVTVHVLREIRDEIKEVRVAPSERIESTNGRLEVVGSIREVKDFLSDRLEIRDRVVRCERDIDGLKSRVGGRGD
jgi:hypothetical protein